MDLSSPKVSQQDKLDLCRKYFYFGFAFLPFLWAINTIWFFKEAFVKPSYPEQPLLRRFVLASGFGALVYLAGFVAWVVVFSQYRSAWGAVADRLSFNIPTGGP